MVTTNLPLPPETMRWGGPQYKDDNFFVKSAADAVKNIISTCKLQKNSVLLDIGCGPGRILIGVDAVLGGMKSYIGMDVHEPSITWCKENLEPLCPYSEFIKLDVYNARYNPDGHLDSSGIYIDYTYDIAYLSSVFTHMRLVEIESYLISLRQAIRPEGYVYCTAFVEQNVPIETENPKNYISEWKGRMHCMRYNRFFFEDLLLRAGFRIESFKRVFRGHGQTHYILRTEDDRSFRADLV